MILEKYSAENPAYAYKGYKYFPSEELEDDNVKIWHDVLTPDGQKTEMGWSPYSIPTEADFRLWIDLGCPKRGAVSLDHEALAKLQAERKKAS